MAICKCSRCKGLGICMGNGGPTERYECPSCKGSGTKGICRLGIPLAFLAVGLIGAYYMYPG